MSTRGPATEVPARQAGSPDNAIVAGKPAASRRLIRRSLEAVDRWLETWPGRLSTTDLACFRILYASVLLLFGLPWWSWTADLPASWFAPPPGPVALLLSAPPPAWLLDTGTLLLGVLLGALLVGYRTRLVSWAVPALWLLGDGVAYSWGKIDHLQLVPMTPLFLGAAGWGDALSVDAWRGRIGSPRRWPITLFAVTIALAMFTAGLPKVVGGWLSPATHAVRGLLLQYRFVLELDQLLADWVARLDLGGLWLIADFATVLVEGGLVLLLVRRSTFRLGLLALVGLHLGVLLTMSIDFIGNVLIYGAFFAWPLRRRAGSARPLPTTAVTAVGLLLGGLAAVTVIAADQTPGALMLSPLGLGSHTASLFLMIAFGSFWLAFDLNERRSKA